MGDVSSLAWTVLLNGCLGLAGYLASRDLFRQPRGWPRVLGGLVLSWAWLTLGLEFLGTLGRIDRIHLLGWTVVGLLIAFASRWGYSNAEVLGVASSSSGQEQDSSQETWTAGLALGLVVWVCLTVGVPSLLGPVKVVSDGPIYHLPFAARWWKSGRLELIPAPFGENGATYFPAIGDLWFTWLFVAWGGDLLAKVGQAPFLLVAGCAVYATSRELGVRRAAAVLSTCWFVTSMPLLVFSFEANVDTIFVAGYLLACYFLVRFGMGDARTSTLALASLAAGAALGTKATGLVFVPPLLLVEAGLVLSRPDRWSRRLGHLVTVGLGAILLPGYFYARNFWLTGNPLYPLHLEGAGRVILSGWYGRNVMQLSPYYLPVGMLSALGDILLAVLDPRLAPFWFLAVLTGCGLGLTSWSDRRRRWVALAAGLALLNIGLYWVAIPYRTQQRFMLQALGLAAVPLGWSFDRSRALRWLGLGLLAVHLLTPQGWPLSPIDREPPWDLNGYVPNRVPALIPFPVTRAQVAHAIGDPAILMGWLITVVLGLANLGVGWFWIRSIQQPSTRALARSSVATAGVFLFAVAIQAPSWPDARRQFFPPFPDYIRGWLELDQRSGQQGARIAYAGTDLPYYLQGVGLRNTVRYINIDEHRDWLLHDYHRAASLAAGRPVTWDNTRPGWDRIQPRYAAWLDNLHAEQIQLLVVTRANPDEGRHNVIPEAGGYPIERLWADSHPEAFELLYGDSQADPRFRIYRVIPRATERLPGR